MKHWATALSRLFTPAVLAGSSIPIMHALPHSRMHGTRARRVNLLRENLDSWQLSVRLFFPEASLRMAPCSGAMFEAFSVYLQLVCSALRFGTAPPSFVCALPGFQASFLGSGASTWHTAARMPAGRLARATGTPRQAVHPAWLACPQRRHMTSAATGAGGARDTYRLRDVAGTLNLTFQAHGVQAWRLLQAHWIHNQEWVWYGYLPGRLGPMCLVVHVGMGTAARKAALRMPSCGLACV